MIKINIFLRSYNFFIYKMYHYDACTIIFGTFSYILSPLISLNKIFNVDFSFPITWDNFLFNNNYLAYYFSLYIAYQKIGVPYDVLILNPSISYFYLSWVNKSCKLAALNYQSYHTENYVFPIFYFVAGPGSLIWINGTAKLTNAFLHTYDPVTIFKIYKVWIAATTLVVVLNAAIILPALSLASIHLHSPKS